MAKYFTIKIDNPCPENWDMMTPNQQGRHCNMCNKTVVDFTNMTDTQLVQFFKANTKNTCGHFYDVQLNNSIALPKNETPWLKYFFTTSLLAFLFNVKVKAQKILQENKIELSSNNIKKDSIEPLKIKTLEEVKVYSSRTISCTRIYICSSFSIVRSDSKKITSLKTPTKNETKDLKKLTAEVVKLFPNPIAPNSMLNVTLSDEILGNIVVEIFSTNGSLLQKELKNIGFKSKSFAVNIKNFAKGFYIIRLTNVSTYEKFSSEFVVQ